ncbi:MAG TPA: hypothetical protein DD730_12890, partial [Desulfosporosinus sp.]|nr:hypothetical protein [Desulfosporosinus sp.]
DYAIPFMTILQSLSPQLKRGSGVEGAEVGALFNTVTKEVIDGEKGVIAIPCAYQKSWIEWKTRETGGGFVKQHTTEDIMRSTTPNVKGDNLLPNGNMVVPTANYYIIVIRDNGAPETVVLSMTKTQLTKAKKWNSIMSAIKLTGAKGLYTPPMFSHKYRLTTHEEEKNSFAWYAWEISNAGKLDAANAQDVALYALAKKLNEEVEKGLLKAKPQEEPANQDNSSEVM